MDIEQLKNKLLPLDDYEDVGKQHFAAYGRNMNYTQYLYLISNICQTQPLKQLYSGSALAKQKQLALDFKTKYDSRKLPADHFFSEGKSIEIEKLLRYVDIPPHQHDFFEFAYIICGECVHKINEEEYLQKEGSLSLIPPTFVHSLYPTEDCLCMTIKIRGEILEKIQLPGLINFIYPMVFNCSDDAFVRDKIAQIYTQQSEALPYCDQIIELLFQALLFYIAQNYYEDARFLVTKNIRDEKILKMLNYAFENYQSITLSALAAHFHYNPAYLSRMFHEQTGKAFSSLLKEFKLRQAAKLLTETKMALNEICDEVGYKDTTQFIKNFKELYEITPGKYRKQTSH